jgi:hypothetical protein
MSKDAERIWWEKTWKEREDVMWHAFGPSHPVDAPEGYVTSLDLMEMGHPGACVYTFRASPDAHEFRERREYWMYATHGLSQYLTRDERDAARARGVGQSGSGYEFAMLFDEPVDWIGGLLSWMMSYSKGRSPLDVGHRVPFQFHSLELGNVQWAIGMPEPDDPPPVDVTRAILFWRYLSPFGAFTTSTGTFSIRVGTTISGPEWELAKSHTSTHLLLLLQWAGIGQRSIPGRSCVTTRDGWEKAWERIRMLTELQAGQELQRLAMAGGQRE